MSNSFIWPIDNTLSSATIWPIDNTLSSAIIWTIDNTLSSATIWPIDNTLSSAIIWTIDRTLSGAVTPRQRVPESNGNEGVLCIPQSSIITGASPLYYLMSKQVTRCGGGMSYPSAVDIFHSRSRLGSQIL